MLLPHFILACKYLQWQVFWFPYLHHFLFLPHVYSWPWWCLEEFVVLFLQGRVGCLEIIIEFNGRKRTFLLPHINEVLVHIIVFLVILLINDIVELLRASCIQVYRFMFTMVPYFIPNSVAPALCNLSWRRLYGNLQFFLFFSWRPAIYVGKIEEQWWWLDVSETSYGFKVLLENISGFACNLVSIKFIKWIILDAYCSGWNIRCMDSGSMHHFVGADSSCISWGVAQSGELGYGPLGQKYVFSFKYKLVYLFTLLHILYLWIYAFITSLLLYYLGLLQWPKK